MLRLLSLAFTIALACPAAAQAEIYVGRDENGTLVLSDRPLATEVTALRTFTVPRAGDFRVTRAVSASVAADYADLIEQHAAAHAVRPELVRAVIAVESAFNPRARSHKGAMGLMQLMPDTAADYGVTNPYNPTENIRAGVAYLRRLLDRFGGNEELALAAYNAGPTAVDRYGRRIPPYRETRDYVARVRTRTGTLGQTPRQALVYKWVEVVDGREIPKYSTVKPTAGEFEILDLER